MKTLALIPAFLLYAAPAYMARADASETPVLLAQAVPPAPGMPRRNWVPMSPKMAKQLYAHWARQAARQNTAQNQGGGIGAVSQNDPQAATASQAPADPDPVPEPAAAPSEESSLPDDGSDMVSPTDDGMPPPAAPPKYRTPAASVAVPYSPPKEEEPEAYAPNRVNQGGIGAVGGLGRIGSP
jgi:hypothetical protein